MNKLITICAMIVLFGSAYARATGTWTTLDYPGQPWTGAFGISGNNIVGGYTDANNAFFFLNWSDAGLGFLYNGLSWTTLDYPGAPETRAFGIFGNNIAGWYADINLVGHGFLYNYNTSSWTTLDYPGADETWAYGISDNNIVGHYKYAHDENRHGFLYNYNTSSWTTLDYPGITSITYTRAQGICNNKVVGYYEDDSGAWHGFIYNIATQGWTTLDYPGAAASWAGGISGNNIVGGYADVNSYEHGFLYNGSTWTTLDYPGAIDTMAVGITANNIVGVYGDTNDNDHGFIYTIPKSASPNPDLNYDGEVNFSDVAILVQYWLTTCLTPGGCDGADLDYSGKVDFADFAILAQNWLKGE
jgi:hypothetical protein